MKTNTLLIVLALIMSCGSHNRSAEWDRENVILIDKSDSNYINAIKSAQKHLPEFIDLLKQKETNSYKFNIRASFTEDGHTEQLWFMVDSFKDSIFYVKLNNVPLHFKKLKLDDKLEIHQDKVKDWLVSKNHKPIAGNFANTDLN